MNRGKLVFAQVTQHVPLMTFRCALWPFALGRRGAFSEGKGYSAAAIQRKTVNQLLPDLAKPIFKSWSGRGCCRRGSD
jgi:hypothetical protein